MRRSLLAVSLWIPGCVLEFGAPTEPNLVREPAAAEPGPVDPELDRSDLGVDSLPLAYHLHFSLTKKDSCSQSWANTTYAGQLTLAVDHRSRARLALEFDTRATSGDWDGDFYETNEHTSCELLGRARWDGDALVIAFRYPKRRAADRLAYECGSRRLTAAVPGFELRCAAAPLEVGDAPDTKPTQRVRVLGCQLDENMPVLFSSMLDSWDPTWVVALGDERLNVSVADDFSGGTIRQHWLEAPN